MYHHSVITDLIKSAEKAITQPISRYGISAYVEGDPDIISADIYIDPTDQKGIAIFREFAAKIAEHYKKLDNEQPIKS